MSEAKLWQLRAGLITESEYMEEMGDMEEVESMGAGSTNANVDAILSAVKMKAGNLKAIKDPASLIALIKGMVDTIQSLNNDSLSDSEVMMGLKKLVQPPTVAKQANSGPVPPPRVTPNQAKANFGLK